MDERAIIDAVLAGDTDAYAELVRAHQARVRLACLTYLGDREDADDAAQEVFVKAFKSLRGFIGKASFETWILRIADNHCRDLLRRTTRYRTESLDALFEAHGSAVEELLTRSVDQPRSPQDLELLGRLFEAIPSDDREILALREFEELPYEEIAQRLHLTVEAVRGRLKRARQMLTDKCRKFF